MKSDIIILINHELTFFIDNKTTDKNVNKESVTNVPSKPNQVHHKENTHVVTNPIDNLHYGKTWSCGMNLFIPNEYHVTNYDIEQKIVEYMLITQLKEEDHGKSLKLRHKRFIFANLYSLKTIIDNDEDNLNISAITNYLYRELLNIPPNESPEEHICQIYVRLQTPCLQNYNGSKVTNKPLFKTVRDHHNKDYSRTMFMNFTKDFMNNIKISK